MKAGSPELAPRAATDVRRSGRILGWLLSLWLARLARGQIDPGEVRVIGTVHHDPPWQRAEFTPNLVVIFRALSAEERANRGGGDSPRILVARIVGTGEVEAAIARLQAEDEEDGEE